MASEKGSTAGAPGLTWVLILPALFLLGILAGGLRDFDVLFGVETYREAGVLVLAVATGVLVLLGRPGVGGPLGRFLDRATRPVPRSLGHALLIGASLAAFLLQTSVRVSGDAESILIMAGTGYVAPSNPLASLLLMGAGRVLSFDLLAGLRLVAAASGLVFVVSAVAIGRACFADRARSGAVTVVVFTAGGVTLFFGTVEFYAPVFAAVALYLLAGLRQMDSERFSPWPGLALGAAACLHGSAVVLLPSLVLLANRGRFRPIVVGRILKSIGWFLLPIAVTGAIVWFGAWGGRWPAHEADALGNIVGGMGQGPILPLLRSPETALHRYVLLDPEHLLGVLNVLLLASPVGLLLVLFGVRRGGDATDRWLLVASALLAGLLFVWNVNYEFRREWELFAIAGLPLAVLGPRRFLRDRPAGALSVAALSLLCFVPMVIMNATGEGERIAYAVNMAAAFRAIAEETGGERAAESARIAGRWEERAATLDVTDRRGRYAKARSLLRSGDVAGAERAFAALLAEDPEDAISKAGMGTAIYQAGRHREGRTRLEEALRQDPRMLSVRLNLARIAEFEGDDDRAIRLLERGLAISSFNPRAVEALESLARLHRKRDETETAETLENLARRVRR